MPFLKNLSGHNEAQDAHYQVYGNNQDYPYNYQPQQQQQHDGSFTHEIIAGAAGFAAMKAYEDHVQLTGNQVSHPLMKEMSAGFAAAEVDKLFETKGLDYLDREKAKHMAVQQAHQWAHEKYGSGGVYNGDGYQGPDSSNYNQGYGRENYGNQGFEGYQQQQWDNRNEQRRPEHHQHHHHRRDEDN